MNVNKQKILQSAREGRDYGIAKKKLKKGEKEFDVMAHTRLNKLRRAWERVAQNRNEPLLEYLTITNAIELLYKPINEQYNIFGEKPEIPLEYLPGYEVNLFSQRRGNASHIYNLLKNLVGSEGEAVKELSNINAYSRTLAVLWKYLFGNALKAKMIEALGEEKTLLSVEDEFKRPIPKEAIEEAKKLDWTDEYAIGEFQYKYGIDRSEVVVALAKAGVIGEDEAKERILKQEYMRAYEKLKDISSVLDADTAFNILLDNRRDLGTHSTAKVLLDKISAGQREEFKQRVKGLYIYELKEGEIEGSSIKRGSPLEKAKKIVAAAKELGVDEHGLLYALYIKGDISDNEKYEIKTLLKIKNAGDEDERLGAMYMNKNAAKVVKYYAEYIKDILGEKKPKLINMEAIMTYFYLKGEVEDEINKAYLYEKIRVALENLSVIKADKKRIELLPYCCALPFDGGESLDSLKALGIRITRDLRYMDWISLDEYKEDISEKIIKRMVERMSKFIETPILAVYSLDTSAIEIEGKIKPFVNILYIVPSDKISKASAYVTFRESSKHFNITEKKFSKIKTSPYLDVGMIESGFVLEE